MHLSKTGLQTNLAFVFFTARMYLRNHSPSLIKHFYLLWHKKYLLSAAFTWKISWYLHVNAKYFFMLRKEKRGNKTSRFGLFMIHSCYRFVCEGEEDDLQPTGKRCQSCTLPYSEPTVRQHKGASLTGCKYYTWACSQESLLLICCALRDPGGLCNPGRGSSHHTC